MYLNLCYDIYMDVPGPTTMYYGCYNGATSELIPELPAHPDYFSHLLLPFKDLDGVICLNTEVKYIFLGMLLFLQTLSLIWFTMILKIIVGVLMGGRPEDTRSDDEADEEEEDEEVHEAEKNNRPMDITDLNVCVGGGAEIDEKEEVSTMTSPKPRGATTARRRLMDAESRKELLARIGCEKPI
jgi:acyl-CoA-dependent ceramide synthase